MRVWVYRQCRVMRMTLQNAFSCQTFLWVLPSLTQTRTVSAGRTQRGRFYLSWKKTSSTMAGKSILRAFWCCEDRTPCNLKKNCTHDYSAWAVVCAEVTCWAPPPPWYLTQGGRDPTCHLHLLLQGWRSKRSGNRRPRLFPHQSKWHLRHTSKTESESFYDITRSFEGHCQIMLV